MHTPHMHAMLHPALKAGAKLIVGHTEYDLTQSRLHHMVMFQRRRTSYVIFLVIKLQLHSLLHSMQHVLPLATLLLVKSELVTFAQFETLLYVRID